MNNNRADRGKNRKSGNSPKLTAEEKRGALAKQLGLKPKTKEFIDNLIENPNKTMGEVYMMNHKTENRISASQAASKLLKKPNVVGYKDAAVGKAKRRIVSLVNSDNESIALKASQDIIDRNEGKATQKTESTSRTVHVSLDLTGVKLGNHYLTAQQASELSVVQ